MTHLVDFHSHFLPEMDDGAESVEESVAMLAKMKAQGVDKVVATPHFYPTKEDPDSFLVRREKSFELLKNKLPENSPKIYLGAEVAFFRQIKNSEMLDKLVISGTKLLLVEMPFTKWTENIVEELIFIKDNRGFVPIIAHFERYPKQDDIILDMISESGLVIQSNAEIFLDFFQRRKGISMLEKGIISLLGSDCHGIVNRPPNLGEAASYILKKSGASLVERVYEFSCSLLENTNGDSFNI